MIYFVFLKFLLPLLLTIIVQEMSLQVLNGGMARMPQATETLAAYGLAWGITMFLNGPLAQGRQLGLVLVDSKQAFRQVHHFAIGVGCLMAGVLLSLSLTSLGTFVIEDIHSVKPELSAIVYRAFFYLTPIPLLSGLNQLYSGALMRMRRTEIVSAAMICGIVASIVTVFVLLPTDFVREDPIRLPLAATYASVVMEFLIATWGRYRFVKVPNISDTEPLTQGYIIRFFWPLAFIMAIQGLSRPVVNLFVARGPDGAEQLAVLTIVYALAHVPYGWINEIRSLHIAFKHIENHLHYIRRFAAGCGLFSFGMMALLFWTPIRHFLLEGLIGVTPELAAKCALPLFFFSFFPLSVAVRAYFHGVGLLERRTQAMAPSAPARISAVTLVLLVLPVDLMHGAARGVLALLSGFICEALVVWWGVKGRKVKT